MQTKSRTDTITLGRIQVGSCPFCASEIDELLSYAEVKSPFAIHHQECNNCRRTWKEIFILSRIEFEE